MYHWISSLFLLKIYFFNNKFACAGKEVAVSDLSIILIHEILQSNDSNSHCRHFNAKFICTRESYFLFHCISWHMEFKEVLIFLLYE